MSSVGAQLGAELARLNWRWTPTHAIITLRFGRHTYRVAIPVHRVHNEMAKELRKVGCRMPPAVGNATVGGFFSSIKNAVTSVTKPVANAIKKGAKTVVDTAGDVVKKARDVTRTVVRSPYLKAGLAAASVIPGAAAITAPTLLAVEAADRIDRKIAAGEKAARTMAKGVRSLTEERTAKKARKEGIKSLRGVKNLQKMARTNPAAARVLAVMRARYGKSNPQAMQRHQREVQRQRQRQRSRRFGRSRGSFGPQSAMCALQQRSMQRRQPPRAFAPPGGYWS